MKTMREQEKVYFWRLKDELVRYNYSDGMMERLAECHGTFRDYLDFGREI